MRGLYDGLETGLTGRQTRGFTAFFYWAGLVAAPASFFSLLMLAALGDRALARAPTLLEVPEFWMALVVVLALGAIVARRLKRLAMAALISGLQLPPAFLMAAPLLFLLLRS